MCTLIILRVPTRDWPVLVAANRDEMAGRPWDPPGRHWDDRPEVVAGRDRLAGGAWLGLNDHGVVAAILNRVGTLGPQAGKRSRGELVLEALDHADAVEAAGALSHLDGRAYRPFNMVVADNRDAFWVRADGGPRVRVVPVADGLHMLTALDLDDPASPRVAAYLPRFRAARRPDPASGDWAAWQKLLADPGSGADGEEMPAMCFTRSDGFGTVSSSLIALPAMGLEAKPSWLFAAGRPDRATFTPVGA
ncbi:MAG TPA: NRDE family protein [Candidatus Omnitrophota bacterium]|nr:NRDE family protein [Candidatus Omnitrophota bacterium]